MKLKIKIFFSFLLFVCALLSSCNIKESSTKYKVTRGVTKFNHDSELVRYHADPWETEWEYECKYNSTLTLVFQGGTLDVIVKDIGDRKYKIIAKERIIK